MENKYIKYWEDLRDYLVTYEHDAYKNYGEGNKRTLLYSYIN